jgi:hypothetical protein
LQPQDGFMSMTGKSHAMKVSNPDFLFFEIRQDEDTRMNTEQCEICFAIQLNSVLIISSRGKIPHPFDGLKKVRPSITRIKQYRIPDIAVSAPILLKISRANQMP